MNIKKLEKPTNEHAIKILSDLLNDYKSGEVTEVLFVSRSKNNTWGHGTIGDMSRFEVSGQLLALANIALFPKVGE